MPTNNPTGTNQYTKKDRKSAGGSTRQGGKSATSRGDNTSRDSKSGKSGTTGGNRQSR